MLVQRKGFQRGSNMVHSENVKQIKRLSEISMIPWAIRSASQSLDNLVTRVHRQCIFLDKWIYHPSLWPGILASKLNMSVA